MAAPITYGIGSIGCGVWDRYEVLPGGGTVRNHTSPAFLEHSAYIERTGVRENKNGRVENRRE